MNSNKTPQFVIRETVTKNGRRLGDQPAGRETEEEVKDAGSALETLGKIEKKAAKEKMLPQESMYGDASCGSHFSTREAFAVCGGGLRLTGAFQGFGTAGSLSRLSTGEARPGR